MVIYKHITSKLTSLKVTAEGMACSITYIPTIAVSEKQFYY